MKKYRKQVVNVLGQKLLVDVPVDDELYKADCREEYQRARSKAKHVSLDDALLICSTDDITEAYEESQLLECLREAIKTFGENERQIIEYLYFENLAESEIATILGISQQAVNRKKHRIIKKLRDCLADWF